MIPRRPARVAATALVAVAVALVAAPPAQAASFRYWTYWHAPEGQWAFATDGPATHVPADGTVEGWRFAVTTQAGSAADAPAVEPSFDALCGATAPQAGSKRVGLVVDPGPAAIAPEGQAPPAVVATCVVVPEDATGATVLAAVVPIRSEGGLVCGLAGYPSGECAPVLDDAEAQRVAQAAAADPGSSAPASASPADAPAAAASTTATTTDDRGSPVPTLVVLGLLLGGAAAWLLARRRGRAGTDG